MAMGDDSSQLHDMGESSNVSWLQRPITVEGVKVGAAAEQTTANAHARREFLKKAPGSI